MKLIGRFPRSQEWRIRKIFSEHDICDYQITYSKNNSFDLFASNPERLAREVLLCLFAAHATLESISYCNRMFN